MMGFSLTKTAFMAVFLCLSVLSYGETAFKFGGLSKHIVDGGETNEFHRVALLEHGWVFGGYARNSYDLDIFVAGIRYQKEWGPVTLQTQAGAVYGYTHCYGHDLSGERRFCPMIAPEIRFNSLPLHPSITLFGTALVLNLNWVIAP